MEDRCICCGEIIPEGMMACPNCLVASKKKTELKPCPFCGGKAEYKRAVIKTNGLWRDAVNVRCTNCDSRTGRVLYDARKHPNGEEYLEVAKAWNRRAEDGK